MNQNRLEHASHNSKVSHYLFESEFPYYDWVITTAFYASIHFVRFKIFPLEYDTYSIRDFDEWCRRGDYNNKHDELQKLVQKYLASIRVDFRSLKETCWRSRYNDYKFQKSDAEKALVQLSKIQKFCASKKSNLKA